MLAVAVSLDEKLKTVLSLPIKLQIMTDRKIIFNVI